MKRKLYDKLLAWKESPYRKPLIIKGARQVGKTYLAEEFGKKEYEDMIVLNCDKDKRIAGIFKGGFQTEKIISDIEILTGKKIIPGKTLLFIDEAGDVPETISSLKYFCEDAPEYHIILAGSLLGLAIHKGSSFPVGKVDELDLYPLSFEEFLLESRGESAVDKLRNGSLEDISSLKSVFEEELRKYYFTGGMPEVVHGFLNGRDYKELRDIQKRILADYSLDIS